MNKKETEEKGRSRKIAILVDGDNIFCNPETVLQFVSRYGEATVRRIYGDWSKPSLARWKEPARAYSFRLAEALPYIKGKNTTDIALIIDAMDLLHSGSVEGFCIVSSDSDYTLLAQRAREEGLLVLGCGEGKTSASFVSSCKDFLYSDKQPEEQQEKQQPCSVQPKPVKGDSPGSILEKESHLFSKAYDMASTDGKQEVTLSQLGMAMKKILPKYKPRRYGCKTLGEIYGKLGYQVIQTGVKGIYNIVRKGQA